MSDSQKPNKEKYK